MIIQLRDDPVPIEINPDGVLLMKTTRVPLDTIVMAFHNGATAEEIAQQYPVLRLADIYAAVAYYLNHQDEVDAYLQQRRQQAADVRRENEARFNPAGIRERLLARRQQSE